MMCIKTVSYISVGINLRIPVKDHSGPLLQANIIPDSSAKERRWYPFPCHTSKTHSNSSNLFCLPNLGHMPTPRAKNQISRGRRGWFKVNTRRLLLEDREVGVGYKLLIHTVN